MPAKVAQQRAPQRSEIAGRAAASIPSPISESRRTQARRGPGDREDSDDDPGYRMTRTRKTRSRTAGPTCRGRWRRDRGRGRRATAAAGDKVTGGKGWGGGAARQDSHCGCHLLPAANLNTTPPSPHLAGAGHPSAAATGREHRKEGRRAGTRVSGGGCGASPPVRGISGAAAPPGPLPARRQEVRAARMTQSGCVRGWGHGVEGEGGIGDMEIR